MNAVPMRPLAWLMLTTCLLFAAPAQAFRCGNELVTEGLHEADVLARCGDPASRRDLGYVVRAYVHESRGLLSRSFGIDTHLSEEVLVTEWIYNFGPRRLMRRLVFEGGWLAEIESMGYGYND